MGNLTNSVSAPGYESNPSWVDTAEYPFAPYFMATDGGRLHYVDEGEGETILMVHGTPTWSFLYRHQIKTLSKRFRCVAVDNLGFGLSDKPENAPYRPEDHAGRLEAFIHQLELRDITLVVHDFGGPIGLSYALKYPGNVKRVVLFNTWMWSVKSQPAAKMVNRIVRGSFGAFLYRKLNASPRFLLPAAFADRRKLTRAVHQQYLGPFPTPESRSALLALARALIGSTDWFDGLWDKRRALAEIPSLIVWGMQDRTFRESDLERWRTLFPQDGNAVLLDDVGHFVQEEVDRDMLNDVLEEFIYANP